MHRRALAAVTSIAVLALLAMPAGDACAVGGDAPHSCCSAGPAPVPASTADSSCCGADASPAADRDATTSASRDPDCHCAHAPDVPAAVVVGTPTSPLDGGPAATLPVAAAVRSEVPAWASVCHHDPVSRSAPPPLFLLDCAFLI